MQRSRELAWLVAAVAFSLSTGCSRSRPEAPRPATVLVTPAAMRDVPVFVEAVASVSGYLDADIRARVRGILARQHAQDGATVKQGQLLFSIEGDQYQAALASARASLAHARAGQEDARVVAQRKKLLAPAGVVSQQEVDDAEALRMQAEAQVEVARAAVRRAEIDLSYTQIRSPIPGVVGLALVRPGNLVGQDGPTLLTTVSQLDPIRVTFPLSELDYLHAPAQLKESAGRDLAWAERQLALLGRGERAEGGDPGVELVLSDGSVFPRRGVILAADRQIDPATGTIRLEALFPNPDGLIRPGQYARVRFLREDEGKNAVVVPEKALVQVQGTWSVAVVGEGNKVQLRRVLVGPAVDGLRVVRSGLLASERVVVEGGQKAADGAVVDPQPAPIGTVSSSR